MSETIKPLSADDLEAVIAIDATIAGKSRRGFFEKRLAAALKNPGDYVYVGLHEGGALIGYVLAKLVAGEFGQPDAKASIDAIGVAPDHQGRGAGHQLLQTHHNLLSITIYPQGAQGNVFHLFFTHLINNLFVTNEDFLRG